MRLARRIKALVVAGLLCTCMIIWKYWMFSEIDTDLDDDYEIKIGRDELKELRRGRDAEMDYDMEQVIKEKLRKAKPKDANFLDFTQRPTKSYKLKLWRSPLFELIAGIDLAVRSPTLDNRSKGQEFVRMLVLGSRKDQPTIYCHILMSHDPKSLHLVTQGNIKIDVTDNGVIQGEILCPWTSSQGPTVISISASDTNVTNHWHDIEYYVFKPPRDMRYGICLNAKSVTNSDADSIMKWFDIQKLLGVKKIILYGTISFPPSQEEVLDHYKEMGFLQVMYWQLPFETMDNGQHLANLDCLYKNMDALTFLFFLELGQYVVPGNTMTMHDMLENINTNNIQSVSYTFQMACFSSELEMIIFDGSSLNIRETFKERAELENLAKHNIRPYSKIAAVRPQLVKDLKVIFNRSDNKGNTATGMSPSKINEDVGVIIHYNVEKCN